MANLLLVLLYRCLVVVHNAVNVRRESHRNISWGGRDVKETFKILNIIEAPTKAKAGK